MTYHHAYVSLFIAINFHCIVHHQVHELIKTTKCSHHHSISIQLNCGPKKHHKYGLHTKDNCRVLRKCCPTTKMDSSELLNSGTSEEVFSFYKQLQSIKSMPNLTSHPTNHQKEVKT